jgi:hypothetical protein
MPAFQATLDTFGKSAFADDAAWCLAFAHFLLGNAAEAAAGLERYGRLPATGIAVRRDRRARRLLARAAAEQGSARSRRRGGLPRARAARAVLVLRPAGARAA